MTTIIEVDVEQAALAWVTRGRDITTTLQADALEGCNRTHRKIAIVGDEVSVR